MRSVLLNTHCRWSIGVKSPAAKKPELHLATSSTERRRRGGDDADFDSQCFLFLLCAKGVFCHLSVDFGSSSVVPGGIKLNGLTDTYCNLAIQPGEGLGGLFVTG